MLNLDMLGALFLGAEFGALAARETPQFLRDLDLHVVKSFVTLNLLFVAPLASWVPGAASRRFWGASRRLHEYTLAAFRG